MLSPVKRQLRIWRRKGRAEPGAPAPFVVGVGRSGTTLLRMMLDAHPELTIPPETHFVPGVIRTAERVRWGPNQIVRAATEDSHRRWGDFGIAEKEYLWVLNNMEKLNTPDAVRAFYRLYAERQGKPRWGDKTPDYVRKMIQLQTVLPEARFIHVIRDGRDASLSHNKRLAGRAGKQPIAYDMLGKRWMRQIEQARSDSAKLNHYVEIRYEDLITDTEATLRRVCEFIDLDFDPQMLSYHLTAAERLAEMARDMPETERRPGRPGEERLKAHALTTEPPKKERIGVWRSELSEEDVVAFESVAAKFLTDLGYELSGHELRDPEEYAEARQAAKLARREARQAERAAQES